MWRYYVYQHRRADTGEVFYVGKGSHRKTGKIATYSRAYVSAKRNPKWLRVVSKHGIVVEIVASFQDDHDSQEFEKFLIAQYGRKALVNMTDGGDGGAGREITPEVRARLAYYAALPRSEAWVESIRKSRAGGGNGGVVKFGDKLPESWCSAISKGQRGPNNYMRGRNGEKAPNKREVVDQETSIKYPTVLLASEAIGVKMKTLYNWLSGHRPNPTSMRFA